MNWRLSAPELSKIIGNGEPKVFITQGQFTKVANDLAEMVDSVEHWLEYGDGGNGSYEALISTATDVEPAAANSVGGDDPIFILYTGGTTGESKGALHSHASVYFGMLNQTVAERIVPSDVYMLTGQMFHIPIVLALNYLSHGCPLVLMNFDAQLALELIQKHKVSAFLGVTTMLNWMMAVDKFETYDLTSLRNIQYGGGPMPSRVIQEAMKKLPCTMIQGYGQTEGTTMTFLSQEDHINAVPHERLDNHVGPGDEGFRRFRRTGDSGHGEAPEGDGDRKTVPQPYTMKTARKTATPAATPLPPPGWSAGQSGRFRR
jgi:long-chain acyl-CoA synthetase